MYSPFQLARKFLRYYLTAFNGKGHGMHSPFVFQFVRQVLANRQGYLPPADVADLRQRLRQDTRLLQIDDFGAGSRVTTANERTVKEIAGSALKPEKYAQLLYRLVTHYKPATILELGTSLGITTAYLAKANPAATVLTIEGCRDIAEVARQNFAALKLTTISQQIGRFDELLPSAVSLLSPLDLAYIDGNHRYAPTMQYFTQLLPALHNGSILVFDDIHWSAEMERAWAEIQRHPAVRCTVDIFFLGFVFFRQEFKEKQHFTVRF